MSEALLKLNRFCFTCSKVIAKALRDKKLAGWTSKEIRKLMTTEEGLQKLQKKIEKLGRLDKALIVASYLADLNIIEKFVIIVCLLLLAVSKKIEDFYRTYLKLLAKLVDKIPPIKNRLLNRYKTTDIELAVKYAYLDIAFRDLALAIIAPFAWVPTITEHVILHTLRMLKLELAYFLQYIGRKIFNTLLEYYKRSVLQKSAQAELGKYAILYSAVAEYVLKFGRNIFTEPNPKQSPLYAYTAVEGLDILIELIIYLLQKAKLNLVAIIINVAWKTFGAVISKMLIEPLFLPKKLKDEEDVVMKMLDQWLSKFEEGIKKAAQEGGT